MIKKMWNTHDYFERIENEVLRLSERFSDDGYVLTLWWGVDGLKMDDRGHCEWIKRKAKEPIYGISSEEAIKEFSRFSSVVNSPMYYRYCGAENYREELPKTGDIGDIFYIMSENKNLLWTGNKFEELGDYLFNPANQVRTQEIKTQLRR